VHGAVRPHEVLRVNERDGTLAEQQLLIYAQELNDLHQQQRKQLLEVEQLYRDLQLKEQHRAQLMTQLLSAQEQERKRIARDIHDGPLQELGVLLLSLERSKRQIEAGAVDEGLAGLSRLRTDVQGAIAMLRALISDLRPPVLDTSGLLGALDYLAGRIGRETSIIVDVSSRIGSRLDPSLEVVVFRLVQEALSNIRQHAQAQHAWIRLERRGAELHLDVRDDGQGFAVSRGVRQALATGHIGLASMRERVEAVGGTLVIESTPRQGTVLHFTLPFHSDPGAPEGHP
jgi:two-component system sensor histidine kinase DegS